MTRPIETGDVVGRVPPPIPNPPVTPGARYSPAHEALIFLRANRDTHSRWAEYFEQNPSVEAEYIATGVWEGASDQRRVEREYNAAIATFERTASELQYLSDRIAVLEGEKMTEEMICAGGSVVAKTLHLTGCERAKRVYLAMRQAIGEGENAK